MTTKRNRLTGVNGKAAGAKSTTGKKYTTSSAASDSNCRSIPVRRIDGRIVGRITGNILAKQAKREHMLREPGGWAWDRSILDTAERAGVQYTEVTCDGLIYRATLADFRRYGFPVRRGHGEQIGLALAHWHIRRIGEPMPAVQLSLFGGAR
jgi:hypothetical protein